MTGLLLAAGASRRMGTPKPLLLWEGETWGDRWIRLLSSVCSEVVVVLGCEPERIRAGLQRADQARFVVNPHWEQGMFSSLRAGLVAAVPGSLLFTPVDLPAIQWQTVRTVAATPAAAFAVPVYDGKRGHPVHCGLVGRQALLDAPPDATAKSVLLAHPVTECFVDDPAIRWDADTPAELALLQARCGVAR